MPSRILPFLLCALWGTFATATVWGQPAVSQISPGAAAPGKTTELVLTGAKLDEPLSVWTSFPASIELVPEPEAKKGRAKMVCKITLAADVPVGLGGIIVSTAEGVSDPYLFPIDDLPSVTDAGGNRSFATAQEIALPAAIDGAAQASGASFYKFAAKAGQRVAVEVLARRLASPLDPVVWLRDAAGREILMVDDDPGLGADCRFAHTFAADGQYIIEIRDNSFAGGGRYRLRVGDFPLVSAPYPLGGQAGQPARFEFAGPGAEEVPAISATVAADAGKRAALGVKFAGGHSSALATFAASHLPELLEAEPNDAPENATKVAVPCAVNGRLHAAKDRDYFAFEAKKGERLAFTSRARSFGSPTICFLRLFKLGGGQLAEAAISDSDEPALTFAIPEDGTYVLMVEDLLRRGGPEHVYRVEIEKAPPFSLIHKADQNGKYKYVAAKTEGAVAIDVTATRAGYDGPISLSVVGKAGPLAVLNNVIPEKQAAAKVIALLPAGSSEGELHLLRVVGKATINGEEVTVPAGSAALLKLKAPQMVIAPDWLDGAAAVAIVPDAEPFYTFVPEQPEGYFPRGIGQTQINIALERKQADYKDPPLTFVEGLPPGFSAEVKRNGNGPKEQYQVILRGPKDAPEGKHAFRVVAYGEHKGRGQKTATPEIPFSVVAPLSVSVEAAGPLAPGQAQKVKISVARFTQGPGAEKQPVTLKWKKLPAGVKAGPEATLPADKDELELELTAEETSPEGKFEELIVTATTKFQGQDVTIDSAAARLEIKKP